MKKVTKGMISGALGIGVISGFIYTSRKQRMKADDLQKRYKLYYDITNQWVANLQNEKSVISYLKKNNIKRIAIYGMGTLGELLYNEIKKTDVLVECFVDMYANVYSVGIDDISVVLPKKVPNEVDVVIVTPVYEYESICAELKDNGCSKNIISLEDIVYDL